MVTQPSSLSPASSLSPRILHPDTIRSVRSSKLGEELGSGIRDVAASRLDLVRGGLLTMIFASVFLQRFALPVGSTAVPLSLFINIATLAWLTLLQQANIDPFRAALVLLFAAYASVCVMFNPSSMFNPTSETWTSALFAIAVYLPFALVLRCGDALFMDCLRAFRSMVLICAGLGILQFALQSAITSSLLFTFKGYVPESLLLPEFNTFQQLTYGSPLYKSNGFFMIEPSTFSQFVAIAIVIELLFYQVKWRLAVYCAALLFSYSGTGLIGLALAPAILVSRRSYGTIIVLALFALLALATSQLWHMSVTEARTSELSSSDSSGYARFIAPADLIATYQIFRPRDLLFGLGPGTYLRYGNIMPYEVGEASWAKVLFEYGVVGSLLFWPLLIVAVFSNAPSVWLTATLMIGFLTFGGGFLDTRFQALLLVFCVLPKRLASAAVTAAGHRT